MSSNRTRIFSLLGLSNRRGSRFSIITINAPASIGCSVKHLANWLPTAWRTWRADLAELEAFLAQCMERLPSADAEVVKSCYATDTTIAQVAANLGRPVGTIKNVLKRSRNALYECIRRSLRREEQP